MPERLASRMDRWELEAEDLEDLERLYDELQRQSHEPEGNDERLAAFYMACIRGVQDRRGRPDFEDGWLMPVLEDMVYIRRLAGRRLSPSAYANKVSRAFQTQIISPRKNWPWNFKYPEDFTTPEVWQEVMETVMTDDDALWEIREELVTTEAHTDVTWRYEFLHLLLHLYEDQFDNEPSILDVGCSLNIGLKKLRLSATDPGHLMDFPYPPVEVVDTRKRPIDELSLALNSLLARPPRLAGGTGIDEFSFRNKTEVAISHSFRPSEWLSDKKRAEELYELLDTKVDDVHFFTGEFSPAALENGARKFSQESPIKQFDVVSFLTIWQQNPHKQRQMMLDYAKNFLPTHKTGSRPAGKIAVQDFAYLDSRSSTGLRFAPRWRDYTYRGYVYDATEPHSGPQEMVRWLDSRCRQVQLAPGVGELVLAKAS